MAGCDLSGRFAVVTGGHAGIGLETTRALARHGATVLVGARDVSAAARALGEFANVIVDRLDLSDLSSVSAFAERTLKDDRHVDILINNAGVMTCPETRVGPGWELQFATNHLGHYALTNLLWPALRGGARVVAVSSAGHHSSAIRWDDVHFDRSYDKILAYGQSKTANILFARHLDTLGMTEGVRAFSLHPGRIFTGLGRHLSQEEMRGAGWIDGEGNPIPAMFKSPEQGAATQLWAATSPALNGIGGVYCLDGDIAPLFDPATPAIEGVRDYAVDPNEAERLWGYSRKLTGLDAFA